MEIEEIKEGPDFETFLSLVCVSFVTDIPSRLVYRERGFAKKLSAWPKHFAHLARHGLGCEGLLEKGCARV